MPAQSLIQIRVDRPLKDDVSALFASLGIDMSTAVRMFFQRCRAEQGIPFPLTFGILDTPSTDCVFEDFNGHRLDRKALDLLRKYKT